jgi:hypothetical protein
MKKSMRCSLSLATLISVFAGSAQGEEPLGRLFSSPHERAALDQARQKFDKNGPVIGTNGTNGTNGAPGAPIEPRAADQITLDGYVRHSSGKLTAWINQTPQHDQEISQGIAVLKAGGRQTVSMQLPSGRKLNLKPGQTFDAGRGKVSEIYENSTPAVPLQAK